MTKIEIAEISIRNFRSIKDSTICLKHNTVLVGKNNIGKTSILDAFRAFEFGLKLSDINIDLLISIMKKRKHPESILEDECLELSITYNWEDLGAEYWSLLSDISNHGKTKIVIRYSISKDNYPSLSSVEGVKQLLELFVREVWIGSLEDFDAGLQKLLPNHVKLRKYLPLPRLNLDQLEPGDLLMCSIMAFRYVDSGKTSSEDATASQFSTKVSGLLANDEPTREVFADTQKNIDNIVAKSLDPFQDELKKFAYPRNPDNPLKAILTIDEWMNNPKVRIAQTFGELEGFELPLNAQGLGYQNIYNILARISAQFAKMNELGVRNPVLFAIEEPEAFTHPQLQHIFIQQISHFVENTAATLNIPYQLLIISHSPEVAISAFEMKFQVIVGRKRGKFSSFINWETIGGENSASRLKLEKLIMNYNAEMLFADKLIAYEGNAERLILTALIRQNIPELLAEKIAYIPVGTSFNNLKDALADLGFEKILLITDLDYKRVDKKNTIDVSVGMQTTNGNLRYLGGDYTALKDIDLNRAYTEQPASLSRKASFKANKIDTDTGNSNDNFMIVTQGYNQEYSFWPRTLESAMVFASQKNFQMYKTAGLLRKNIEETILHDIFDVNDISGKLLNTGKADFALDSLDLILTEEFTIPEYLLKGLRWLANADVEG